MYSKDFLKERYFVLEKSKFQRNVTAGVDHKLQFSVFEHSLEPLHFLIMAAVHGIRKAKDRGQFRYQKITFLVESRTIVIISIINEFCRIITYRAGNDSSLFCGKSDDLGRHDDAVRTLCHIAHADVFTAVMELYGDLEKKTFSCTHTVDFLHAVKDRQCDIRCALDMVFAAGIAFGNVSGSNQNVIFEIVGALDEFLLFSVIVGNSIKKRNSRNPDCFCLENVDEVFADDHRRNDQGLPFHKILHRR